MLKDARVLDLARKFSAYEPEAKAITIRGERALLEFARAVIAEHECQAVVVEMEASKHA